MHNVEIIDPRVEDNCTPEPETTSTYPEKLIIRSGRRTFFQRTAEIDCFTAAANYVNVHAGGEVHRIRATVNRLEQRLDPQCFGRIHRCAIVNFKRVAECRPLSRGDYLVTLLQGRQLKMSRKYGYQLKRIISALGSSHSTSGRNS